MIKGSIQEEDITIINTYAPNLRIPKYAKQTLTELKTESHNYYYCVVIIISDFITTLSILARSSITEKSIAKH